MTTEELRLKITVDTSDVKNLKKELTNVQKDLEKKVDTSAITQGTKSSMAAVDELRESIESLENLSFANIITSNLEKIHSAMKNVASAGRHVGEAVGSIALGLNNKHWKDLGYDTTLSEGFKNLKWGIQDAKESWVAAFGHMKAATHDLGEMFPPLMRKLALFAAAVAGIVATIRNGFSIALQGKQMNVLAQQAGMSADAYQRWAFILSQTGLQVDDMIGAQQTLLEAQVDVREGSEEMIAAFKQIGLSQQEVLSMNQQQLFERTVAGLQNMGNATERATVAFKLLSEDSKNLAPLLNLTNEQVAALTNNYDHLHSSMSDKLIEASNRLQASVGNLKAAWQGLRNTLAELIMPILTTIVNALTKAMVVINLFLRTIFGMEIGGSSKSEGIEGATNNIGGYTESVENATAAVEKLKRTTMGFDELNIVGNPNSGGSSGGGADAGTDAFGGGFAGGFTDSLFNADNLDMSGITSFFEKWRKLIQDITTWGLIGIGVGLAVYGACTFNIPLLLKGIALAGLGIAIGSVDGGTFDRLRQKFEEWNAELVPVALIGIGAAGAVLAAVMGNWPLAIGMAALAGVSLATIGGFQGLGEGEFAKACQNIVAPAMMAIGVAGTVIALLMGNLPVAIGFAAMAGLGVGLYQLSGGSLFEDLGEGIKSVWEDLSAWFNSYVKPVFTKEWWANKFETIKQAMSEKLSETRTTIINAWNNIREYWNTNIAPKFTLSYWQNKFDTIRAAISQKLGEARTTIMNAWNKIREYWNVNIAPKFTLAYWQGKFDTMRAAMSEKINAVRTTVINGWNNIRNYWNTNIGPKFTVSYWKGKFNTIKDGAKAAFNGVIAVVEQAVNGIIKKINTLSWKIPDWVPKFGGNRFGFSFKEIKIPRLATGGIAVSSTLANIGENGREAILPLDSNTGWMDALATKLAQRMNPATKVVLMVNERELGYATINAINQNTKQTGGLKLQLV